MTEPGSGDRSKVAAPIGPSVGVFWQIPDERGQQHLVVDREHLLRAEPYGDCLTHPRGHYEVWNDWQRQGFLRDRRWPLAILVHEYEDFPRGRVVFHVPSNAFWIYADRRLQRPVTIANIKAAFWLAGETWLVKSDDHYR